MIGSLICVVFLGMLRAGLYMTGTIGYQVTFGYLDIVNLAHPFLIIFSALLISALVPILELSAIIVVLILLPLFGLFGVGLFKFYRNILKGQQRVLGLVFFFGVLTLVQMSGYFLFGLSDQFISAGWAGTRLDFGFESIRSGNLIASGAGIGLVLLLRMYLKKTYIGRATEATIQSEEQAILLGIDPDFVKMIFFGIGVALVPVGGFFFIHLVPVNSFSGIKYLGIMTTLVVFSGKGNLTGLIPATIIVSVIMSISSYLFNPVVVEAIPFIILLSVFIFKPTGLMGKKYQL